MRHVMKPAADSFSRTTRAAARGAIRAASGLGAFRLGASGLGASGLGAFRLGGRLAATTALALLLATCDQAGTTRGIGPVAVPAAPPPLLPMENDLLDGAAAMAPGRPEVALAQRVAVVIGNSRYQNVTPLENPRRDARAVTAMLEAQGYLVLDGTDLGKQAFEKLLRDAVVAGGKDADIVVFYAGHGFQVGSRNYLLPVDAALKGADDLPMASVRLDSVLRMLRDRSGRHVAILDACRNNPFPGQEAKPGISNAAGPTVIGFTEPVVPPGGLVAYSTAPGAVAYDGDGLPNSPFTSSLVRRAGSQPEANFTSTLGRIKSDVRAATGGKQVPSWTSRIGGSFALVPRAATTVAAMAPEPVTGPKPVVVGAAPTPAPVAPTPAPVAAGPTPVPVAPTPVPVAPGSSPSPSGRPKVVLDAPMEQVVALGSRVSAALDVPPDATVTITSKGPEPEVSAIVAEGSITSAPSEQVPASKMGAIVYTLPPDERIAPPRYEDAMVMESFVAEVKAPGRPAQSYEIDLRLLPDPCDWQAGDWFDLQGVGLYQRGGIASPHGAIEACTDAVARMPHVARFQFQLGSAHESAGNYGEALRYYRIAANMGHMRAWYALGHLALRRGERPSVAEGYFLKGTEGGDPLAIEALGILRLRNARTPAEREAAYDLLGYAVDLGLPDAMRELAGYYANPQSPDHNLLRARAFQLAAELREHDRPASRPNFAGPATDDTGRGSADPGSGNGGYD